VPLGSEPNAFTNSTNADGPVYDEATDAVTYTAPGATSEPASDLVREPRNRHHLDAVVGSPRIRTAVDEDAALEARQPAHGGLGLDLLHQVRLHVRAQRLDAILGAPDER
jgi:hypothetical protein